MKNKIEQSIVEAKIRRICFSSDHNSLITVLNEIRRQYPDEHETIIHELLNHTIKKGEQVTPLIVKVAAICKDPIILETLIANGADANRLRGAEKPLLKAIENSNIALIEFLMQNKARFTEDCINKAIDTRNIEVVKTVLKNDSEQILRRTQYIVSSHNCYEVAMEKPLTKAAYLREKEIFKLLIEYGASPSTSLSLLHEAFIFNAESKNITNLIQFIFEYSPEKYTNSQRDYFCRGNDRFKTASFKGLTNKYSGNYIELKQKLIVQKQFELSFRLITTFIDHSANGTCQLPTEIIYLILTYSGLPNNSIVSGNLYPFHHKIISDKEHDLCSKDKQELQKILNVSYNLQELTNETLYMLIDCHIYLGEHESDSIKKYAETIFLRSYSEEISSSSRQLPNISEQIIQDRCLYILGDNSPYHVEEEVKHIEYCVAEESKEAATDNTTSQCHIC